LTFLQHYIVVFFDHISIVLYTILQEDLMKKNSMRVVLVSGILIFVLFLILGAIQQSIVSSNLMSVGMSANRPSYSRGLIINFFMFLAYNLGLLSSSFMIFIFIALSIIIIILTKKYFNKHETTEGEKYER